MAGCPLPLDATLGRVALDAVRRYARSSIVLTLPGAGPKTTRAIPLPSLGAEIDRVRLAGLVADALDPGSALRRGAAPGAVVALPVPLVLRREAALATLLAWRDAVDRPAVDARFDLETKRLVPEQEGLFVDVFTTLARLDAAVRAGETEVAVALDSAAPRLVATQMGGVEFGEVLGFFETRYATDKKHEDRTFNLRLAASKLDGHVILPGEVFDFNQIVGPRDEASGYRVAPVIAQGELVDGIGGGTCQIAGTLHGAAFFAGLDLVERHPHTRPSFYIKMGLDATVVYPTITLRLRNSFDHPVVLHETVRDGVVRAEVLGPKRTRTVTFVRKIDDVLPFAELERPDPKLKKGVTVLAQRGIPGFRTHRYRIVREGSFAVRERFNDSYPPTNQIVRVGTGEGEGAKDATDDPHPEYVADDYLVLLQGPDEKKNAIVELREAGRTGEYGWTARAGFSHYRPRVRSDGDASACTGDCPSDAPGRGVDEGRPGGRAVAERGAARRERRAIHPRVRYPARP